MLTAGVSEDKGVVVREERVGVKPLDEMVVDIGVEAAGVGGGCCDGL